MNQKTYLSNWRNKLSFKYRKQKHGKSKIAGNSNLINFSGFSGIKSRGVTTLTFKQQGEDMIIYLDLTRLKKGFNLQNFGFGGFQFKINNVNLKNFKNDNGFTETLIKNPSELSTLKKGNFSVKVNNRFSDFQVLTKLHGNSMSVVMFYIKDSNLNAIKNNKELELPIFYHKDRRKNYPIQPLVSFSNLISDKKTCISDVTISSKNGVNLISRFVDGHLEYDNRNSQHCDKNPIVNTPEIPDDVSVEGVQGDANLDSLVNVSDVVLMVSHILGEQVLTEESFENADVNQDGQVNVADIVAVVNEILNLESEQRTQILHGVDDLISKKDKTGENDV